MSRTHSVIFAGLILEMNSRCARREKRNHPIANGCGPALGQDPSSVKLDAVQCDVPGRGDSERTRAAMPSVVIVKIIE